MQQAMSRIAEKFDVAGFVIRLTGMLQSRSGRPTYGFGAFKRHVDIDIASVGFEGGFLSRYQRRILHFYKHLASRSVANGISAGYKVVIDMRLQPINGHGKTGRHRRIARTIRNMAQYHSALPLSAHTSRFAQSSSNSNGSTERFACSILLLRQHFLHTAT